MYYSMGVCHGDTWHLNIISIFTSINKLIIFWPSHKMWIRFWQMFISLWEFYFFCNWHCNLIFELHKTLVTHYIYTLWMLMDKLHELHNCNSLYIWCNSLQFNCNSIKTTNFQLLCNSIIIAPMMSWWRH